jgi:putative ABC transport system substrate-binding protein
MLTPIDLSPGASAEAFLFSLMSSMLVFRSAAALGSVRCRFLARAMMPCHGGKPMTILRVTRRAFVGALGCAPAWPVVARAQHQAMPVVGFLSSRSPDDSMNLVAAFRGGLGDTGFIEGHSVAIEYRWAEYNNDRLPTLSADLVVRQVAVIAANSIAPALAAKAATAKIPIIFLTGADPVQFNLIHSLSRPEGNLTGVAILSNTLAPKQLELLHEIAPTATQVALLVNPKNLITETDMKNVKSAAGTTG